MRVILCIGLILLAAVSIQAGRATVGHSDAILLGATSALRDFTREPISSIPVSVRATAKAIAVFPTLEHDGPVYRGRGILSVRNEDGLDSWSAPGMLRLKQAIMPAAATLPATDLVLVVLSRKGVFYLSQDRVESDKQPFIPPGPIGADTEVRMKVDMLSYTRLGQIIAGATLKQLSLEADKEANEGVYGRTYATREILFERPAKLPEPVAEWREALAQLMSEKN